MRKAGPILILLIGILALVIDFVPGLSLPDSQGAAGTWRQVETKLGLDLSGGLRVEYQAQPVDGKAPTDAAMSVIKDIVERRVNTTGVSEPVVTTQGKDRVVVELPGVTDPEAVRTLVGISLVFAFMLIYYRLPGAVASFALIYYTLVMYAIFRLVPVTLTLAGIAGFVLSVGMAVDANILIFERMKEELRVGKSLPAAVEAGFNRAWNSILDSNVSSLITATILYALGSSVIRGFALVLILGVLVSMFSAIVVTRTILRWMVRQEWARKPSVYGLRDDEFVALGAVRPSSRREARGRV